MTASVAAFEGQIGQTAYSASKGGIVGMTLPLARDLERCRHPRADHRPGLVDTPIYDLAPPGLKEALGQTTVFPKRLGKAEEFAQLAEALAENTYMNGEVVRMDAAIRMSPK